MLVARAAASFVALSALLLAHTASAQPAAAPTSPPAAAPTSQSLRIAILDTQKVLRETEEGMRIEANLRKLFDSKQADLLKGEKQLTQEYEDLQREQKQKGGKADAALEKKLNEFRAKYQAFQQAGADFQREFARKQNELYNPMLQKVGTIVKGIASTDGYDLVIDKQAAIHFRRDLDITERVIQAYNAGNGGAAKPKQPAPKKPAPKK